jgi:ASPIC/UnbV protein
VMTADGEQRQEVRGGGSYYSQSDLRLQFGLGDAKGVERIVVRWPNGAEETWAKLEVDRIHVVREGEGSEQEAGRGEKEITEFTTKERR